MVVFGSPILAVACAGVLVAVVIAPDHRTYAWRVMLGLTVVACVGLAVAGLIWYAMTPLPHSLQPKCWASV
jgi:multisubunit Na+/H+ antiporter MnhB subunit